MRGRPEFFGEMASKLAGQRGPMATHDDCVAADAVRHTVYRWLVAVCVCCLSLTVFGCRNREPADAAQRFEAEIPSTSTWDAFDQGIVYDESGRKVQIRDLSKVKLDGIAAQKKHLLIFVTRGIKLKIDLKNEDCQSCAQQTAALSQQKEKFIKHNCEVVIIVPTRIDGPETVKLFRAAAKSKNEQNPIGFRIYYDESFKWSKLLGITTQNGSPEPSAFWLDTELDTEHKLIKVVIGPNWLQNDISAQFNDQLEAIDTKSLR